MIDLHTHILPGIDDGAKDLETSLSMLQLQKEQGVNTVVLTPHFYPSRENSGRFLKRREEAAKTLAHAILEMPEEEQVKLPQRMVLGAEVAWAPNLAYEDNLDQMCLGNSRYMLLELPFEPWNKQMVNQIYHLTGRTGITPVIAHLDRYQKLQKKDIFEEIVALGVPVQLGTDMLFHWWNKRKIFGLLEKEGRFLLASDCHNLTDRKPNLKAAFDEVESKLGADLTAQIRRRTVRILDV